LERSYNEIFFLLIDGHNPILQKKAKRTVIKEGYRDEFESFIDFDFSQVTPKLFFEEYLHVVVNSGMKYQVAQKIISRMKKEGYQTFGHIGKRKAIEWMAKNQNYKKCFAELASKPTDQAKLEYLESLPYIGNITKFHLARNLGLDIAKPDRHLVRFAKRFGYKDVQQFCKDISKKSYDTVGVIDVVLWRYVNFFGSK